MFCPVCETVELKMAERQGIEIDYCPTCRGVWLDRGELDKIIERSTGGEGKRLGDMVNEPAPKRKNDDPYLDERQDHWDDRDRYYDDDDDDDYRDRKSGKRRMRRKKDFLEDLFDIFD